MHGAVNIPGNGFLSLFKMVQLWSFSMRKKKP